MAGGNTPHLVLKRMQGHFRKIAPLKKILEFLRLQKRSTRHIQKTKLQTKN